MSFLFLLLCISVDLVFSEVLTVCATTSVNLRDDACGTKVGTADDGEMFTRTGDTKDCNGYTWYKFTTNQWAASDFFEACVEKMNICTPSAVDLVSTPCSSTTSKTTTAMEKFRTTGDYDDTTCSKTFVKLDNDMWIEFQTGYQQCYSKHIGTVDLETFLSLFSGLPESKGTIYHPYFNSVITEGGMTTCDRMSSFVAQIGHESASLYYWEEIADGSAYEGRTDLCNTETGDGPKFKGRGPIQLTGRCNYRDSSKYLFNDENVLLNDPYQVATCDSSSGCLGFRTTWWYWKTRNLNTYSDYGNQAGFDKVTLLINGGTNGKADRDTRWNNARTLLDCDYTLTAPSTTSPGAQTSRGWSLEFGILIAMFVGFVLGV